MNKFEIENLELYYGDFKALKNINMMPMPSSDTLVWVSILPSW